MFLNKAFANHHHPLLLVALPYMAWNTRHSHFPGLGIRGWYPALHGIPILVQGQDVYLGIDKYLKQVSPPARNFKNPWHIQGTPLPAPEAYYISFEQLVSNIRTASL